MLVEGFGCRTPEILTQILPASAEGILGICKKSSEVARIWRFDPCAWHPGSLRSGFAGAWVVGLANRDD